MQFSKVRSLASRAINKACFHFVPDRMNLPFYYWLHVLKGAYENELRYLHKICEGRKIAIDVGANQELFSYILSKRFSKVYTFEGNNDLTNYLNPHNSGNIKVFSKGLSSEAVSVTLRILIQDNDYTLTACRGLTPSNYPNTTESIVRGEKEVSLYTIDSFDFLDIGFIKIDVEGHRIEALKGGIQILALCYPIVLIEIKDENMDTVFTSL